MRTQFTIFLILVFLLGLVPVNFSNAANLATRLKGRILLQVESNGEAWYVNPDNEKRYYLGRPADAFQVMRELGLGISNNDFDSFNGYAPSRLSGKILLKVEDSGKAYYVNPADFKMHYLGRPVDAFQIMRELGLGITNNDLNEITINNNGDIFNENLVDTEKDSDDDGVPDVYDMHPYEKSIISNKVFKYKSSGKPFSPDLEKNENEIQVPIPRDRYMMYAEHFPHTFKSDYSDIKKFITPNEPAIFYLAFQLALTAEMFDEEFTQLAIDFVQQLYYNDDKWTTKDEYPKYPVETLMDGSGDCEDLSFLLASILQSRRKNDNINFSLILFESHLAVGWSIKLFDEMSKKEVTDYFTSLKLPYATYYYTKNNHKYFYIEATNDDFEIGETPDDLIGVDATIYELGDMSGCGRIICDW